MPDRFRQFDSLRKQSFNDRQIHLKLFTQGRNFPQSRMLKHKNITLLKAYLSGNHAQLRFRKLRPMTYLGEVRHEKAINQQ